MRDAVRRVIREIHRRSLWQVLAIYVGASWVVYGFVDDFVAILGMPGWIPPFALVLVLLGLPIVLATAFVQEGGPARKPATPSRPAASVWQTRRRRLQPRHVVRRPRLIARFLTWDRTLRGGVFAFAMFVLVVGSQMGMRATGIGPGATLVSRGVIGDDDVILLADFASSGGDASIADVVREAIRIDLEQAGDIRLVAPAAVAEGLARMRADEPMALDEATARELAIREGFPVVLVGDVRPVGAGYLISARLVDPASGEALAAVRRSARGDDDLVTAVDELSRALRAEIGESIRSIARSEPLARVTTASLDALRSYTRGIAAVHVDDLETGVALLEDAVRLDPEFATAWRSLAIALGNLGAPRSRILDAATRAYENRHRLPPYERQRAIAAYHTEVTGDRAQVIAAYRTLLDLRPDDWAVLNNLGFIYFQQGELPLAAEMFARSLQASDSSRGVAFVNRIRALVNQGELAAAATLHARFRDLHPTDPSIHYSRMWIDVNLGDFDAVEVRMGEYRDQLAGNPVHRASAHEHLRRTLAIRGRLAEAERNGVDEARGYDEWGIATAQLDLAIELAFMDLWVRGQTDAAASRLATALREHPLDNFEVADRPYARVAELLAYTGQPTRARELLRQHELDTPAEVRNTDGARYQLLRARAAIAVAEGRHLDAVRDLREARGARVTCTTCGLPEIGHAFEQAAMPDSAIAAYQLYLGTPDFGRLVSDGEHLPRVHERLATLLLDTAPDAAADHRDRLARLWRNADPILRNRVPAAPAERASVP